MVGEGETDGVGDAVGVLVSVGVGVEVCVGLEVAVGGFVVSVAKLLAERSAPSFPSKWANCSEGVMQPDKTKAIVTNSEPKQNFKADKRLFSKSSNKYMYPFQS